MTIKAFSVAAFASVLSLALNCGQYGSQDALRDAPLTSKARSVSAPEGRTNVSAKSVEFFAWWWSHEQLNADFDEQKPPPRTSYIKLEQWEDTSKAHVPHPDRIDVVCQIENKGDTPADLVVLVMGDWIIAPQSQYSITDLDTIADEVAWTGKTPIGREVVRNLAPGESKEVTIKNFRLRQAINNFSGTKTDTLWTWKFRAHVYVEKINGGRLAQRQAVLSLIPRDAKLGY